MNSPTIKGRSESMD